MAHSRSHSCPNKEDDTQTGDGEETNVGGETEAEDKSEVAKNANEPNPKTDKMDCKMEGTEERLGRLPFGQKN
jgi:hypothetical protein